MGCDLYGDKYESEWCTKCHSLQERGKVTVESKTQKLGYVRGGGDLECESYGRANVIIREIREYL